MQSLCLVLACCSLLLCGALESRVLSPASLSDTLVTTPSFLSGPKTSIGPAHLVFLDAHCSAACSATRIPSDIRPIANSSLPSVLCFYAVHCGCFPEDQAVQVAQLGFAGMLLQGRIRPTGVGALQLWKRNGVAQIPMYEFSTLAHKNFREWEIVNLQASPNPHEQTAARAQQFLAQSIIGIAFTVKFVFECIRIRHHWEFRAPQVELERSKWCHRISISVMIISIQMICSALGIFSSVDPFSRLHIYNTFWFYFFIYALPTTGFVATYTLCLTYMRIVQKFYGNQLFQLHLVRVFLHITMVVLLLSAVSMTIIQGFNMRFSFFSYLYTFNAGLGLVYEIVIAVFFMHTKQKITKSICESNDVKKIGSGAAKDNEKVRRMSYFLQLTSFLFLGIILSTTAFLLLLVFGYDYLWALASQSLFIALSGLTQILSMPRAPSGQDNLPKARKSSVNPSPIRTSIAFN